MSEDAAAAARRIVAEVLGRQDAADEAPSTSTPSAAARSAEAPPASGAGGPVSGVEHHDTAASEDGAPTPDPGSVAGPPREAADPAAPAAVARRIVEQVLAASGSADEEPEDVSEEARIPVVPTERSAAPADDGVERGTEPPEEQMPERGPAAPDVTDEGSSAAEIVRRIVSEVTADAADPASSASDPDAGAGQAHSTSSSAAGRREPTRELGRPPRSEGDIGTSSTRLEAEPTREVPGTSDGLEETQRVRRQTDPSARQDGVEASGQEPRPSLDHLEAPLFSRTEAPTGTPPETAVSVLEHAGDASQQHPSPVENDGGFEATVEPPGLASRHEPLLAKRDTGSQDDTAPARWLMISILGALALAVLFPMAVAALRALVALS